jgi:murein DD-endopeptidase MepM/ murein hydrolase activator NlpD
MLLIAAPAAYAAPAGPARDVRPAASTSAALGPFRLPVDAPDRRRLDPARLTAFGSFGHPRVARTAAPAHLHAGLDFRRPPGGAYAGAVYPIAPGEVIGLRDDGPFAQIMVAHPDASRARLWTVYEHVAGIRVSRGDRVTPKVPMARLLARAELDRHGHHFDHLHLEILRAAPRPLAPTPRLPERRFGTYALECRTEAELAARYHDPGRFLDSVWRSEAEGRPAP